jgi:hypothetical protein
MRRHLFSTALLGAALAAVAAAQTLPAPFTIRTVQPNSTQTTADGGSLVFISDGIGLNSDASVTITYKPTATTITAGITIVDLSGSTDFSLSGVPGDLTSNPVLLTNLNSTMTLGVRYRPTTSKAVTGKITFTFVENDSASPPSFRGPRVGTFSLNLSGSAPEFAYSYAVQPNGNSTLLNQNDTITLPAVAISSETASVAITIANRGTAPGVINGVTIKGASNFALAGVPFPPITVDANKTITFSVRYSPDDLDPLTAAVRIDFVAGRSLSFNVTGSGLGAEVVYELLSSRGAWVPLEANSTITIPDAVIGGDKTTATIRVSNVGNADGRITAISAAGTGFAVAEAPFLPYTVVAGTSFTVVVSFTASQPGKATGRLRIGNDNFNVEGSGLGSNVTFSYAAAGGAISVISPGTVVFPPTSVGSSSTVQFTAKNEGTAPTQINSISVAGTGTTFAAGTLPTLPVRLAAGASVTFSMTFAPVTVGSNSGTLKLDTNTFTLSGAANPPDALPSYTFSGATGSLGPQQQPAIGFSLNAAYPLALAGTLTLNFTSDVFSNDPAVQFSSGGRTIAFTIPANSRQAVFPNGATQVRLQTGTVAGTITLTPSFTTTTGGIDLTPTTPPSLTLTVPQGGPQLLSAVVSAKTASTFTLLVTGFATGRSITQMDFTLTPTSGENVTTSKVTLNVDASFTAWYQSTASQAFGSLFTVTVPFTVAGDVKNVTNVVDTLQSVAVTLTNRLGTSSSQSVSLK